MKHTVGGKYSIKPAYLEVGVLFKVSLKRFLNTSDFNWIV